MNATQFDIVSRFLKMGSTPKAIASGFNIDVTEVIKVQAAEIYANHKDERWAGFLDNHPKSRDAIISDLTDSLGGSFS